MEGGIECAWRAWRRVGGRTGMGDGLGIWAVVELCAQGYGGQQMRQVEGAADGGLKGLWVWGMDGVKAVCEGV